MKSLVTVFSGFWLGEWNNSEKTYICELRNQINKHTLMEVKELYVAPVAEKLELTNEGIVCMSPGNYSGFGEEEDM